MKKPFVVIFFIILIISVGINIFLFWKTQEVDTPLPSPDDNYPFLASFVDHAPQKDRLINFYPLRDDLTDFVATQSSTLGLYFEYVPTGVSIGINSNQPYLYASLLKLPLAMAIYNAKELGQISFSDEKTLTNDMINPYSGNLWKQGPGTAVTVGEAIKDLLVDSDNTAFNVLTSSIPIEQFQHVFDYLDIPIESEASQAAVTPKNYTSILKSLLYSSYLNPEDSQEILNLLNQATFTDGIRKGVPPNVPVAHKFGIRNDDTPYLSDCGIIYHPNRPYFLCVMENAESIQKAESLMQAISAKIYNYISTKN